MTSECDVLVVGAGPAGSSAAMAAAQGGLKTILIDKKEIIGEPVQCAEAIGKYLIPLLPVQIPTNQLVWDIEGITFYCDDIRIKKSGGMWSSYGIRRDYFDKWLAQKAILHGAVLKLGAELIELELTDNNSVKKALIKTSSGVEVIKPKIVIGCDGVNSRVLHEVGFSYTKNMVGYVKSFEIKGAELTDPYYDHFYVGDFASHGYGYMFPKSKDTVNIGVGVLSPDIDLDKSFDEFLAIPEVNNQLRNGKIVGEKSGVAPYSSPTEKVVFGNILLTGDSANQNFKPFVEGVLPGVICGHLAGKSAVDFFVDKTPLESYPDKINEKLGIYFNHSNDIYEALMGLDSFPLEKNNLFRLGLTTGILTPNQISNLQEEDTAKIKELLLTS